MLRKPILLFIVLFYAVFLVGAAPEFRPLALSDGSMDPVFVCTEGRWQDCNKQSPSGQSASYAFYLQRVLANEWHTGSNLEALKAGIIAVRTFANREIGCGAYTGYTYSYSSSGPYLRVLANGSQSYLPFNGNITNNHISAQTQTDGVQLTRSDGTLACAKYFANTGDPTHSCAGSSTLSQCPNGSSDRATLKDVTEPVATNNYVHGGYRPGMSQNGSAAWTVGNASWDYRQILVHYYRDVNLAGSSSSYYRWNWLNVGDDIEFTGLGNYYEQYYAPGNPAPDCLYVNGGAPVNLHIQNTSRQNWSSGSVQLYYRWFNSGGTQIGTGGGIGLPAVDKSRDVIVSNIPVYPPSGASAGQSYTLKWDLKRGSTWFSSQNNWPTLNKTVCILADTTPPHNPPQANVTSGSGHIKNDWASGTQISLTWSGASDDETWVSGYSIVWNQNSTTTPDKTQGTSETTATSNVLSHGNWYLHVRTKDNAGNWAIGTTHYGPYGIDTISPESWVSNAPTTPGKSWLYLQTTGTDSGAGIASILIQYKIDNGAWQNYVTVNGGEAHTVLFTPSRYNRGHDITSAPVLLTGPGWWKVWGARIFPFISHLIPVPPVCRMHFCR